ncbi:MAG: hypothetical protein AB1679_17150 [Actinomycetota bacterium]
MNVSDDYEDEMRTPRPLDDTTVELILTGQRVGDDDLSAVAAFVADLRSAAASPPPRPSAALAAVLAQGVATTDHGGVAPTSASQAARPGQRRSSWAGRRPRLMPRLLSALTVPLGTAGFGAKAAFGFSLAAASVTAAGAAGVLPDPLQHTVAGVVRAVSPFEIPDPADHRRDVGHRLDPDSGDDAGSESPLTIDETVPPADEHQGEPGRQPPDSHAPIDTSSPRLDETDRAPADGSVPTTVQPRPAPADQDPRADAPTGAPGEAPADQPRDTPTTEPGSAPAPGGVPTSQPEHTPSPSGDLPAGAPEEGSGGGSETPPTTQPATTSTTRPAGIPSGRR